MNSARNKSARGPVELFLTREFFNSLVTVLQFFLVADSTNKYGQYAARLKEKILHYSRAFINEGEENVVVYFYEDEAAILLKLFTIYFNATEKSYGDFYQQIRKK